MKTFRITCLVFLSLLHWQVVSGQGFINRDFELSAVVSSSPSGYGFDTGTANVPGWTTYHAWGAVNYSGGTTVIYNNQPLDAAGAFLEAVTYWTPAIQGNYSILLQGGSVASASAGYGTNGAAIGQTGQVPPGAKSITYWGNASGNSLQITFDGQALSFIPVSTAADHTVYGADISAYAGLTGELLFHAPWATGGGMIDQIQFSSSPLPEPSVLSLFSMCIVFLRWRMKHLRIGG